MKVLILVGLVLIWGLLMARIEGGYGAAAANRALAVSLVGTAIGALLLRLLWTP